MAFKSWWGHLYMVGIIYPLVKIGLRWQPKLGGDQSPCPQAHRRAWSKQRTRGVIFLFSDSIDSCIHLADSFPRQKYLPCSTTYFKAKFFRVSNLISDIVIFMPFLTRRLLIGSCLYTARQRSMKMMSVKAIFLKRLGFIRCIA